MKQSELIKLISNDTGIKYEIVRKILRKLTKYMAVTFANDETVQIGMGTFKLVTRKAKSAYNFAKKEKIMLPPRTKIAFTPSNIIKGVLAKKDLVLNDDFIETDDNEDLNAEED